MEYAKDIAREIRLSDFGRELYPKRKYTIERTFAQAKMSHCLGFTLVRGLRKNQDRNLIVFVAANLKKLALFVANTNKKIMRISSVIHAFIHKIFQKIPKKQKSILRITS